MTFDAATYDSNWVDIGYDGGTETGLARELNFTIDGDTVLGYCIDLDLYYYHTTYNAELVPLPTEAPWCRVANLLDTADASDAYGSGVLQAALQETIYADEGVTVDPYDADAQALIDATPDTCFAACSNYIEISSDLAVGSDGLVTATVQVTRGGEPISGRDVAISSSLGTLVDPADGAATTDADGNASVVIDPEGAADGLLVTFTVEGRDYLVPTFLSFSPLRQTSRALARPQCRPDRCRQLGRNLPPAGTGHRAHHLLAAGGRHRRLGLRVGRHRDLRRRRLRRSEVPRRRGG